MEKPDKVAILLVKISDKNGQTWFFIVKNGKKNWLTKKVKIVREKNPKISEMFFTVYFKRR